MMPLSPMPGNDNTPKWLDYLLIITFIVIISVTIIGMKSI